MKTLQCAIGSDGVLYEVVYATSHEFRVIDDTGGTDFYPFALYADARSVQFFLTMKAAREHAHKMNLDAVENLKWQVSP